jgi:hypothetical protein
MNTFRLVALATALAPVIAFAVIAGCQQQSAATSGAAADHGLCYAQPACSGESLLELPTLSECKAAGGKSWSGLTQKRCSSI